MLFIGVPECYQVRMKKHLLLTMLEIVVEILKVLHTSVRNTINLREQGSKQRRRIESPKVTDALIGSHESEVEVLTFLFMWFRLAYQRHTNLLERLVFNRPFPSSLVPLFQSESKCETILMKMTLICISSKRNWK